MRQFEAFGHELANQRLLSIYTSNIQSFSLTNRNSIHPHQLVPVTMWFDDGPPLFDDYYYNQVASMPNVMFCMYYLVK